MENKDDAKKFQVFGLLKLVRVLRLNRIIMYLNLKQDIKAVSTNNYPHLLTVFFVFI